jgi:protein-disulfide isomerase
MRWNSTLLIAVAAILAGVTIFFFSSVAFQNNKPAPATASAPPAASAADETLKEPMVTFIDPAKGEATARHTVVVYSDYACPFCAELNTTLGRLYVDAPKTFRLVWKDIPNSHYPGSDLAAESALCAKEQGRFWEYHDRLFESGANDQIGLALLATDIGLNGELFAECLSKHATKPIVERAIAEASALGIDETPSVFIDGKAYNESLSYDALRQALAQ